MFLIALAGARRSEIHALCSDSLKWKEDGSIVLLYADPKFLAKTELVEGPRNTGKGIMIKGLTRIVGRERRRYSYVL